MSAATAAMGLRASFEDIKLALVVGICGGVPNIAGSDAFLGDVVLSRAIIRYDYGRQYDGEFVVRQSVEDSLGRANRDLRGLLRSFETERARKHLRQAIGTNLSHLQSEAKQEERRANYDFPGPTKDRLFKSAYIHRHRKADDPCETCANPKAFCEPATKASCEDAGCHLAEIVQRSHRFRDGHTAYSPEIFVGRMGSGNAVMKSGADRDRIAKKYDIAAFEMEGAGAWDELPCLVVKGICDYADSHKDKRWQDFAAATAASVARAILDRYVLDDSAAAASAASSNGHPGAGLAGGQGSRIMQTGQMGSGNTISLGDTVNYYAR